MHTARQNKVHGFTLIELLVVVAIIALLISILLPSLSKARETARSVVCASILKQNGMANQMYADAEDNYFAPIDVSGQMGAEGRWHWNTQYRNMLSFEAQTGGDSNQVPPDFLCPAANDFELDNGHWHHVYTMNGYESGETAGDVGPRIFHRSAVVSPSSKLQMTDGTEYRVNEWDANYNTLWDPIGDISWWDAGIDLIAGPGMWGVAYRHSEGANVQFFDGHVDHMDKTKVYPENWDQRMQLWFVDETYGR